MVYELRKFTSFDDFRDDFDLGIIAWETDEIIGDDVRFSGKLIAHVLDEKTVVVPDGIEVLGYSFLVPDFLGGGGCACDTVHVPASVKTIEEGAFANSSVCNIIIDPASSCGVVKDNGLYTKDGKTLLWILGKNTAEDYVYVVPKGVTRIGIDFTSDNIEKIVIPNTVTEIGYNEENSYNYENLTIQSPKGSYAIEFAKEHNMAFEEID